MVKKECNTGLIAQVTSNGTEPSAINFASACYECY